MYRDKKEGMSVITPFLNEEKSIVCFCKTIDDYVGTLNFPVEIVFVDDGSTDDSIKLVQKYHFHQVTKVKILKLSKNYGAHIATRAGIKNSCYDICTWMSTDLQEPLEILPIAYEKIHSGEYEAVYFEKRTVKVSKYNRIFSKIYSHLMRKYAVKEYSADGTATIAFGRKIKDVLNDNIEANSSLMLQIINLGFRYDTVPLDYHERTMGVSKWTLAKKIKLFIDSFVAFSYMPIRMVSIIGILIFLIGLIIGVTTIINKLVNPNVPIGYSTLASIMALGFGVTNISLGIIAEYLWRTYDAARGRQVFIIADTIDLLDKTGEEEKKDGLL